MNFFGSFTRRITVKLNYNNRKMAYDAESARYGGKIYGALMGPNIYKSIYNTEMSRLELILFGTTNVQTTRNAM